MRAQVKSCRQEIGQHHHGKREREDNKMENNNIPVEVRIECARGELLNSVQHVMRLQQLQACVIEGVLNGVLADIRGQAKIELLNTYIQAQNTHCEQLDKLNTELLKAKTAAKKVLKEDTEQTEQEETNEQNEQNQ